MDQRLAGKADDEARAVCGDADPARRQIAAALLQQALGVHEDGVLAAIVFHAERIYAAASAV